MATVGPRKFFTLPDNTIAEGVVIVSGSADPVPITTLPRTCTGHQTLSVTAAAVVTLTPPGDSLACAIQADGASISLTTDGTTVPTSTIGFRLDDGIFYYVDTDLADVKLIARNTTTNVQVTYFNRA